MNENQIIPDSKIEALAVSGRRYIDDLLGHYTPSDAETEVLVAVMAAANSVMNSSAYPPSVKGDMMGRAMRAAFNYGRLQGAKSKKRKPRPKVKRKK